MDKILRKLFYILSIIALVLSSLYIAKYYLDMHNVRKESNLLNEISLEDIASSLDDSENSNIYNVSDTPSEKTERMLKLEELQKENKDIVAWIEIEGTNVNYPVLQGLDNDYYMTHNYKREYTSCGSIFLDKDYNFSIPSTNFLIYGHNMKNGTMFKDLLKYKSKDFFNEHQTIRFTTSKEDAIYEIISVFESRVYYKSEQNVFRYYYFVNAKNEEEFNYFVTNSKNASLYDTRKNCSIWRLTLNIIDLCIPHRRPAASS